MRGCNVVAPLVDRLIAHAGWRTSTVHPIRVDFVDLSHVPALRDAPGRLGMTFLPGKQRDGWTGLHWRDLELDAEWLRDHWAVDAFVLLVEDHELAGCRVGAIDDVFARRGIDLIRLPLRDMDVPRDVPAFGGTLDAIDERLAAGQTVVVACRGGLGRTGTLVACLLRDGGLGPDEAIALTREARPDTIERGSQLQFVRRWQRRKETPAGSAGAERKDRV